ncbi:MAG: hypothetical protein WCR33_05715 [Bacilli bacterium]
MFKRANKGELKTWLFGDILIFIFATIMGIVLLSQFINDTTKVAGLVFCILFLVLAVFCFMFMLNIIRAYLSIDSRTETQEAEDNAKKEQEEQEKQERLEKEMEEMEAIKRRELSERAKMKAAAENEKIKQQRMEAARRNAANPDQLDK